MDVSGQHVIEDVSVLSSHQASHVKNRRFRRLPEKLIGLFLDILYEYRGDFLRQIDDLLGPHVTNFVAGKRPLRPIAFDEIALCNMQSQPMDSDYFVRLCRVLVSTMDEPT